MIHASKNEDMIDKLQGVKGFENWIFTLYETKFFL